MGEVRVGFKNESGDIMKEMNIMTSSDSGLLPYISIQLQSIFDTIKNRHINFYLLHNGIDENDISKLERQCAQYENISFNSITIIDDRYDKLAKYGGGWSSPAYYSLMAHNVLPEDMDRILYIDAGDVIFMGDPTDYYDSDFMGNALIVTTARYKKCEGVRVLFEEKDLGDDELIKDIVRGLFNSGSYVINLNYMRDSNYSLDDYLGLAEVLSKAIIMENGGAYWGDQGLLSAMFVGCLKGYDYPDVKDIKYMPNNFCMWYFDITEKELWYRPNIIHFAGAEKPWKIKYPNSLKIQGDVSENELVSINSLRKGQTEYYNKWYKTALKTQEILEKS